MDIDKKLLALGFKVMEYRKLGMRWCKLERMFNKKRDRLMGAQKDYKAYLQEGGEPFLNQEPMEN